MDLQSNRSYVSVSSSEVSNTENSYRTTKHSSVSSNNEHSDHPRVEVEHRKIRKKYVPWNSDFLWD
jgi:hypothetical protein